MPKINSQQNRGFTLLEALVAISILMVAVAAPITIAQKGLSSAVYFKNQMIASYLVQDVIEYIKNQRDVVSLNNNSNWSSLWSEPDGLLYNCLETVSADGCQIDTVTQSVTTYNSTAPTYLLKGGHGNTYDGFYQYDQGDPTIFTRQVQITKISNDEALLKVTVSWGSDPDTVVVNTLIYNY